MSSRGASAPPNENNDIFRSETCKNQPTIPFMKSQFSASGVNLQINNCYGERDCAHNFNNYCS
ncbi:hypothetical protein Hanom_Chr01g00048411 [Helianthus anomalus]